MAEKYEFNLDALTIEEYSEIANSSISDRSHDEIIAKITGISVGEIKKMPFNQYRRLIKAFFNACAEPLADPL
jgi:hypothetical protein